MIVLIKIVQIWVDLFGIAAAGRVTLVLCTEENVLSYWNY